MPRSARAAPPTLHTVRGPEPPKTPKARRTRAGLLSAAVDLFVSRSYGAVSMNDVSASTGLTKGAVYGHFRSKAQLLVEAIRWKLATYTTGVDEAVAAGEPLSIDALFGEDARVVRLLQIDAAAAARQDEDLAAALAQMYRERLATLRDRFAGSPDPEVMAWLVSVIFDGIGVSEAAGVDVLDTAVLRRAAQAALQALA